MAHRYLPESCKGSVRGLRLMGAVRALPISYSYCISDLQDWSSEMLSSVSPSWRDSQTENKHVLPLLCLSRRSKHLQQTPEHAAFTYFVVCFSQSRLSFVPQHTTRGAAENFTQGQDGGGRDRELSSSVAILAQQPSGCINPTAAEVQTLFSWPQKRWLKQNVFSLGVWICGLLPSFFSSLFLFANWAVGKRKVRTMFYFIFLLKKSRT